MTIISWDFAQVANLSLLYILVFVFEFTGTKTVLCFCNFFLRMLFRKICREEFVNISKQGAKILWPSYPFLALLRLLVLHGPHDEEQEEAVQQADQRQDNKWDGLPAELVQDAPEWRRHQAAKRDEGESDAQGLGALRLLSVPEGMYFFIFFWRDFLIFCYSYYIQHCFICRPSDSTVLTDAGVEPKL
jgi:hypothetical protein